MGQEALANTVSISIEPSGKTISNIPWVTGMNVQYAMEEAYSVSPKIDFAIQYYGSNLGYLVLMIDKVSDSDSEFWFLSINGVSSATGIDSTFLNDGDLIGFNYEKYSESKHGHIEIHKAKHAFINA